MKVTAHCPYHWRERMCQMLLIPLKAETMRLLEAWTIAEGALEYGATGGPKNNPLNTTYPMPWSSDFNSVGVKHYDSPVEGICAQAATLARDERYLPLWKDLQKGTFTAEQLVDRNQEAIHTWGTDIDLLRRVLKDVK